MIRKSFTFAPGIIAAAAIIALAAVAPANAGAPQQSNLLGNGNNWMIYSVMPSTSMYWDIDKAGNTNVGITFPFQEFLSTTEGSFAVYLLDGYNVDLTGATISATAHWTQGTYMTRSTPPSGAYARIEFQDVTEGPYVSSDYWWYFGQVLDLSEAISGTVTAALADRAHWLNLCGKLASDTTDYPAHPNCVGGTDPAGSPYDGFTHAMQNVKQVSLSFGSSGRYASGVAAADADSATFTLDDFSVTH